jgi:hypothetical protein
MRKQPIINGIILALIFYLFGTLYSFSQFQSITTLRIGNIFSYPLSWITSIILLVVGFLIAFVISSLRSKKEPLPQQ